MSGEIVSAECTRCGRTVHRVLATVEGTPGWRQHVVCRDCREAEDPVDAHLDRMLAGRARQRWADRAVAFDAAAGLDQAALPEGPDAAVWVQHARAALRTWADPAQQMSRSGLMLVGPTGIGKTWAGFALANAVADAGFGDAIRVATELDLLGPQVATWEMDERLRSWVDGAAMLMVDDIGVASRHQDQVQAGWKRLCDVVASQPRSLIVVGTSNRQSWMKPGGLAEWMGQQSASRMRSWTTLCTTGAQDRRTGDMHENWARHTGR